jgi:hypothetical protein
MNLLGHTFVADTTGRGEPEFLLGAVLPDLVSIARVRLDRSRLEGDAGLGRVGAGVACHNRTDAAFHGHPAFVAGAGAIRRELSAEGMARGPARAIGHIGWELLLDGTLVGTATEDLFRTAMGVVDKASGAVADPHTERWARFLANVDRMGSLHYDDPAWVADRLYGMLASRPLLAFDPGMTPVVAATLEAHVSTIAAAADGVLTEVSDAI